METTNKVAENTVRAALVDQTKQPTTGDNEKKMYYFDS